MLWSAGVHGGIEIGDLLDDAFVSCLDGRVVDELEPNFVFVAGDQGGKIFTSAEAFQVPLDLRRDIGIAQDEALKPLPVDGHEVETLRLQQPRTEDASEEVLDTFLEGEIELLLWQPPVRPRGTQEKGLQFPIPPLNGKMFLLLYNEYWLRDARQSCVPYDHDRPPESNSFYPGV